MSHNRVSLAARAGATLFAAAAISLAGAAVAEAHVRVTPDSTAEGGYSRLTFRVPNESDTAGTTSVAVSLPTDTPFSSVMTKPVPGWKAEVVEAELPEPIEVDGATVTKAPATVTWTAEGDTQINPGEYQEFSISVGPLPKMGTTIELPTKQTYSDGEVADWNQPTVEGEEEPESPAPAFEVTAVEAGGHHAAAATDADAEEADEETADASSSDSAARWLGAGGLAVGVAGLAFGALAWRRASAVQNNK
ncbi:YcnI family copper-binding membrane protein [Kineosporia babensis]|uniref:YcnI family protein n=1 Tax=Kineosporia babensis TaxID=499548 RepID=A0A9X1T0N9_9ACTN|nr:YcnI family protein [Kineosporia babensis]MCD5312958.1 YcnI family protein [Kineosporia babensis]